MKELRFGFAHLRQTKLVDKVDNLLKRRFDNHSIAADGAEAKHRALPQVLMVAFGNGHIELIGNTRLNSFQDAALAFERVTFRNQQIELEDAHDHGVNEFSEPRARNPIRR